MATELNPCPQKPHPYPVSQTIGYAMLHRMPTTSNVTLPPITPHTHTLHQPRLLPHSPLISKSTGVHDQESCDMCTSTLPARPRPGRIQASWVSSRNCVQGWRPDSDYLSTTSNVTPPTVHPYNIHPLTACPHQSRHTTPIHSPHAPHSTPYA